MCNDPCHDPQLSGDGKCPSGENVATVAEQSPHRMTREDWSRLRGCRFEHVYDGQGYNIRAIPQR